MVFQESCILVLWTKVVSALEGYPLEKKNLTKCNLPWEQDDGKQVMCIRLLFYLELIIGYDDHQGMASNQKYA